MRRPILLFTALLCCSFPPDGEAGDAPPEGSRPKIGLALGGGGARGVAHVGVLEWLEEHHVPVDFVAGTSAGGLVGGVYATGVTPTELRALIASLDWDRMFRSDAPYALKDFRRKEDARDYPAHLEIGMRHGLSLPSGLDTGQEVDLLLGRLTQRYFDIRSFDDLPVPFRCIATDLVTGEAVVLGDGSLASALRATMSFPGVFTPVSRGGRLLADGGISNNVPVDIVRSMGADIVIAVDVGAASASKLGDSIYGVVMRSVELLMNRNAEALVRSADVVIKPDLKGFESDEWRRSREVADRGYHAAASTASLAGLAVDERTWAAYLTARNARRVVRDPVPEAVTVAGVAPERLETVRTNLARYVGRPLDGVQLGRDLTAVFGSGRYATVTYELVRRPEAVVLAVAATPKTYGPPFLSVGLDLTNRTPVEFQLGLRGRITALDLAGPGSEARIDLALGTGFSTGIELYKPVGRSRVFIAPRATIGRSHEDLRFGAQPLASYRVSHAAVGLDVGIAVSRRIEWRVGYSAGRGRADIRTGDPRLPEFTGPENIGQMRFAFEGQDAAVVPSRGVRVTAEVRRVFRGVEPQPEYAPVLRAGARTVAETSASVFVPVSTRHRVMGLVEAGTHFGAPTASFYDFALGGPLRLRAYDLGAVRGRNYVVASAAYFHNIGRLPGVVGGPIYALGSLEGGSAFTGFRSARVRTCVSGGFVTDTTLGPVMATAGVALDGHYRVYLAVGRTFK